MLKVLFITSAASSSGRANVGDRVILAGVRNLIASAFGYYIYKEAGRWSRYTGDPDEFDLIVYAGMPQYGIRHEPSMEEQHFQSLIDASKRVVFMNIGGGAIHGLSNSRLIEAARMAFAKGASYYRRQKSRIAYRSVRDRTSKLFFDFVGAPAKLRCCPSYYATLTIQADRSRAGAISAISNRNFVTNQFQGDMQDLIAGFHDKRPDFDLVAHSGTDLGMLAELGMPHLFFRTETALLSYYASVRQVISMRVHAAIPAWTAGADVVVGGFDNRVGMFDDVGMPVPWVRMVNRPAGDVRAEFEAIMADKSRHIPLAQRREKIEAQLRQATRDVRDAAPALTSKASGEPVRLEGWGSYPPAGAVRQEGTNFRLVPLPLHAEEGPESSRADIVRIPANARAASASKSLSFPLAIPASEFRMTKESGKKSRRSDQQALLVESQPIHFPRGSLWCACRWQLSGALPPEEAGRISFTQAGRVLGEQRLTAADLRKERFDVRFENDFPAMPVTIRIQLFGDSNAQSASFGGVEIRTQDESRSETAVGQH